ncbi:hypothetical protein ABKN59_004401 [Abortiporus biennis]
MPQQQQSQLKLYHIYVPSKLPLLSEELVVIMQSGRTRKVFRVHKDFKPDSYTVSQPPPLCSFEKGIPLCAFGYKRSRDWLREYTLKHQLVADIIPEIQSQYDLAQVAAQYIYKQIGQERYLSTKEGDGPYEPLI